MVKQRVTVLAVVVLVLSFLLAGTAVAADAGVQINKTNFPDETFRTYVQRFDKNKDGVLSSDEIAAVKTMTEVPAGVKDCKGIAYFTALEELSLGGTSISSLNLSSNKNLRTLDVNCTLISELNLSSLTKLQSLILFGCSSLKSLDVSKCTDLLLLDVSNSGLTSLNVTNNKNLSYLSISRTAISSINLSNNTQLRDLDCRRTGLSSLDVTACTQLCSLDCSCNALKKLDLSKNGSLSWLICGINCFSAKELSLTGKMKTALTSGIKTVLTSDDLENRYFEYCSEGVTPRIVSYSLNSNDGNVYLEVDADVASGSVATLYFSCNESSGEAIEKIATKAGQTVTIPKSAPVNFGYYFLGWALSPKSTTAYYKGGDTIKVTKDTVLYAVWKPKALKVTFDLNGGKSGAPAAITGLKTYDTFIIPKSSPVREGYYFLGWSSSKSDKVAEYVAGDGDYIMDNLVLYAVWKARNNKVTFNSNGGVGKVPAPIKVETGAKGTIPANKTLTRSGYYFMGWATTKAATTAQYKTGDRISVSKDTTLYAVWKAAAPAKFKLSFDRNGGSGNAPAAKLVTSGTKVTIAKCSISRTGFYFMGWSTTRGGAVAYKSGSSLTITKDTVLYAVWKKITCTLRFDRNGGSGNAPAKTSKDYGTKVTVPKSSVNREGYYFLGWSTTRGATTAKYKSGSVITLTDNVTLYAVWKKK